MKGLQFRRESPLRIRTHNWAGLFLFFLAIFCGSVGFAQTITVKGNVMSDAGSALPNVSVQVKGSSAGTATDSSGNFTINVPNANAVLVFSSVGYTEKEEAVNGREEIAVVLTASAENLEQVVVIGYGTQKKENVTGSIGVISSKDLQDRPNPNPISSVQGKVSGVQILNSGAPGGSPRVDIRGISSITGKTVFIVDGMITDDISFLNPQDIESMSILKDASSLAIFGAQASNGAVIIKTKAGRGKPVFNLNSYVGV
ncbi:carboxypeptidase-like regulatory domain-containing protein [Niabella hibiscisoli]|uniref:carboxypeptidase-like regulatory domain-containing protein n=1 Tax=Niabella hibiscisoli TaxID=1825928 RepID=UPI001F0F9E07|nr:carboxypeptidase-like regulatory domain-containing protein [Niabella hibiscisoli]MCH5716565.1 TonB-dependent receptor plug domain-containing protein [Niabella hibiscisoli]